MSRMLKVFLFLCVAAACTAAASSKKNPDVERAVKAQLMGKMFATKILVGSYIPCSIPENSVPNNALEMVDTELSPDGSIRYYARHYCFYPGGIIDVNATGYVETGRLSGMLPSGTPIWVVGLDFKDDRVEVRLEATNATNTLNVYNSLSNNQSAEGSGKIKYMVGAEYRTWSADQLMEVIARGLAIPSYEKLTQLKSEYEELLANLQEAENNYNSTGLDTHSKLVNAIALSQVLEKLQKNRAEYIAMGKSDAQAGTYTEKLNALTPEVDRLSEEVRKERIAKVREQLKAQLPEFSEIQLKSDSDLRRRWLSGNRDPTAWQGTRFFSTNDRDCSTS